VQQDFQRHRKNVAGVTEPARFATRLLARSWLSSDTLQLDLERPPGFVFVPGQGIRLSGSSLEREYSLISAPDDDHLSICVQVVEKGAFSPQLARLGAGSNLSFSGPHGYFIFQPSEHPVVFVATGTGIAPFVSMARAGITGFTLLHGASSMEDLHYRRVVQPAAGRYLGCVTRERFGHSFPSWGYHGRVSDFLKKEIPVMTYDFYLCGNRAMVRDVASRVDESFPGSRVFFEVFF
jgi:benzoate/toluate 1,2-dioxygenase reductase component